MVTAVIISMQNQLLLSTLNLCTYAWIFKLNYIFIFCVLSPVHCSLNKEGNNFQERYLSELFCRVPSEPRKRTMSREVIRKVLSVEQDEGVGARVRRSIGRPEVRTNK